MEDQQLTVLRRELEQRSARAAAAEEACSHCRDALAAILQALAPQALAAAFGFSQDSYVKGWSLSAGEHAALAQRLMTQRQVGWLGGGWTYDTSQTEHVSGAGGEVYNRERWVGWNDVMGGT